MSIRIPLALVTTAAALTIAVTPATAAAPSPARADKDLDAALRGVVGMKGGPPGVISVVQRDDARRVHAVGVADLRTGTKPKATDHMRIASMAKAFSGAAALRLVQQGRLSLDDTLAQRLPTLPAAWGAVTLRQLLDHTSGLPDYTKAKAFQAAFGKNPHMVFAPHAKLLDFVATDPLNFAPGSEYRYSNSDNIAVGLMVEAVTGTTYADFLASDIDAPLGLTQTTLPETFRIPAPYIHGYDLTGRRPQDISTALSASGVWASGGIISTPAEVNTFIRGYVGRRLFDQSVSDQQLKLVDGHSEPIGPGANLAGVGIFQYTTKCGVVYGHTGNFPGYTQFMAASLDGSRSVTVAINEQLNPDNFAPGQRRVFSALRSAEVTAVCAALAGT